MYRVESGDQYLRFANFDNKAWIVPLKAMRVALAIYQPSGVRGVVAKRLLPYIYWVPQLRNVINASRVDVTLDDNLTGLICRVFKVVDFEFSIFEGTPSVQQKVTIQIFRGSKILGYCKVSNNPDVVELFEEEQRRLNYLHDRGVSGAPRCCYCGDVGERVTGDVAFIISTTKRLRSQTLHSWSEIHQRFLEDLHTKTKRKIAFAESDFARSLTSLEGYLAILSNEDAAMLAEAIEQVRGYYTDGEVEFSVSHGDFAPWNMFVERGALFVFDWEHSSLTFPPYMDRFHFVTQVAIFEKRLSPQQIAKCVDCEFVEPYKAYLLTIISRYIGRERGALSSECRDMLHIWFDIMRKL